jgi:hypothetical protein
MGMEEAPDAAPPIEEPGARKSRMPTSSDVVPTLASRVWRFGDACSVLFVQADGDEVAASRQELMMGTSESPGRHGLNQPR